jgi:hypothetical protein
LLSQLRVRNSFVGSKLILKVQDDYTSKGVDVQSRFILFVYYYLEIKQPIPARFRGL